MLELSFNSLLTPFRNFNEPHFWGLGNIEIQESALSNKSFNIIAGEFLFSDGTYTAFPGNTIIEARPFEESWLEEEKPLKVFIGLKKLSNVGNNVTVMEKLEFTSAVTTRFVSLAEPEKVSDLYSGDFHADIKSLYHVLKIFYETEIDKLGDYLIIPVAQIERDGDNIRLSTRFVQPCLAISVSKPLFKLIKEIKEQIGARAHDLEQYKSQKGVQTAEFGSRDMVYLLALRTLNRYVPLLQHIIEAEKVSPWMAYGVLRQLIGELTSFSENVNVLGESENGNDGIPGYDHTNIWKCFSSAQDLIIKLLDEITAGPEYVIRLNFDGTYYTTELNPTMFGGHNRYYLVIKTEEDPKSIIESLTSIAKLNAREHLPILIARALPGLQLDHLPVPPQELPRRSNTLYFLINHHCDQWSFIVDNNNIALYWDNAPEDLNIELMIVAR